MKISQEFGRSKGKSTDFFGIFLLAVTPFLDSKLEGISAKIMLIYGYKPGEK